MTKFRLIFAFAGAFLAALGLGLANASAADVGSCEAMLRHTGRPVYRIAEPDHDVLCRKGYVLAHNAERKVADWVLEELTAERLVGPADRRRARFLGDPDVGARGAAPGDYRGFPYHRGHLAAAEDMKWSQEAMAESFYMTNVAPQVGRGFNTGVWKSLEARMRRWAARRERLIVITGPIYGPASRGIGPAGDIAVPEAFFKIAYDPDRKHAIAFLLPNQSGSAKYLAERIVAIREIEDLTGLDFLTALSRRDQNRIETIRWPMWR
jgi:endonuclease G